MPQTVASRRWVAVAVAASVIALDQLTKWWALNGLADGPIHLIGPLELRLTRNIGGAFGLGAGFAPVLAVAAFVLVGVLGRSSGATRRLLSTIALALILGGALGNLIDRLVRDSGSLLGGAVVDFIDTQFWPVFNVADMAIVGGGILLVLSARHEPEPSADAD